MNKSPSRKFNLQPGRFAQKQIQKNCGPPIEVIKKTLASGVDVLISNFCKFYVKGKEERNVRNPATGDDLML